MSRDVFVRHLCASWALALVVLGLGAGPVRAHALLRSTEPAAEAVLQASPTRVVLRFSEPVEAAFGAIRVYDTDGERVDDGRARHPRGDARTVVAGLASGLPHGTYTVAWRVVSGDGHPVSEAFLFHVGAPGVDRDVALSDVLARQQGAGTAGAVWLGVARWLLFAGLALLIGAWAFAPLVWRGLGAMPPGLAVARARLLRAGLCVSVVATLMGAVGQIAVAADLPLRRTLSPSLYAELLRTRYGVVAAARLVLLGLAALTMRGGRGRAWRVGPLLLILAATPGLSGHAGATQPAALHVVADALHVAAAGVWLGGLVLMRQVLRDEIGAAPAAVRRFSKVALRAVALLVLTGLVRSWAEVGAPVALWSTAYGMVLLAKLAMFAPMLGLAAWNRFRIQPRLQDQADDAAPPGMRRLVTVEAGLGALVLVASALLVNLVPAKVAAGLAGPAIVEAAFGDGRLDVVVDPNVVGQNTVHLTMATASGRPLDVASVRVRFRLPERGIGPIEGEAIRLSVGHFAVQGRELSVPGRWTIEVLAQVDRFTDLAATVSVRVNA